ncbi:hypothetical protein ACH5RR_032794 [Cinchona calisaya]|uniref:DUF2442 domain-containing protein n=1 Tax=Cinchona calisaya TaxID=153742 RepID=A0ABD2YM98_9GENT
MGNNTAPVFIDCKVDGHPILQNKEVHGRDNFYIKITHKGIYYCDASWGVNFANFNAYSHERDATHKDLTWIIGEEGMFLGWDDEEEFSLGVPWVEV